MHRRLLCGYLALAAVAGTSLSSFAAPGDVLGSIPAPAAGPYGIAWDGTNLWVVADGPERIYEVSTAGAVLSSFAAPSGGPTGLTWDGSALWLADDDNDVLYRLSTTGTVLATIPSPGGSPHGLTWDGSELWNADKTGSDPRIYEITTAGTVVSSFASPSDQSRGLTWDGVRLWHVDKTTDLISELSITGTVLSAFPAPCASATGITFDGTDFWIVCGTSIFRVEGGGGSGGTLSIVKRAFLLDGTPVSSGASLPQGTLVRFLLYVSNPGPVASDLSLRDVLDPTFVFQPGTLLYDVSSPACALGSCNAAEETAILAAVTTGTTGTDPPDADPVSFAAGTVEAGDQNVANGTLDVPAGSTFALAFTVRMQ